MKYRTALNVLVLCIAVFTVISFVYSAPSNQADTKKLIFSEHNSKLSPRAQIALETREDIRLIVQYNGTTAHQKVRAVSDTVGVFKGRSQEFTSVLDDPSVIAVEIDQPLRASSWNLERVRAPLLWNYSNGSGVAVAVLDSGSVIAQNGYNVLEESNNFTDVDGHGTAVEGVVRRASPDVDIYAVKVMEGGSGWLSDAVSGLAWAVDQDIAIAVMSFGFDDYSQIFRDAVADAYAENVLLVGASGNTGGSVSYPAAYSDVIAVGAIDSLDVRASFSNYGLEMELVAPGINILTDGLTGTVLVNGTSVAAPHVAGVAALLLSEHNYSASELRVELRSLADDLGEPGLDTEYGYGVVQAAGDKQFVESNDYNYTVYNVSGYNTAYETLSFYVSGYGSIDDVNFSAGFYYVNKTRNDISVAEYLFVDENGTIIPLTLIADFDWDDGFNIDGTSSDGKIWLGDSLQWRYDDLGSTDTEVYCVDENYISSFNQLKCYGIDNAAITNCAIEFPEFDDYCSSSSCGTNGFEDWIDVDSSHIDSVGEKTIRVKAWGDCSESISRTDTYTDKYYIVDRKRTECWNQNTAFLVEGEYDDDEWKNIGNAVSCGSGLVCSDQIAGSLETTNREYDFYDTEDSYYPCVTATGVDLAITDIIPIQVIPDVPMIKDKNGYVVVVVENLGTEDANASVTAWFEGTALDFTGDIFSAFVNQNPYSVSQGQEKWFVFNFTPANIGNDLILNASVEVLN